SLCRSLIVTIKGPQSLRGTVTAPGSKAYTHRALLASLLSQGETVIQGASECDDAHRTLEGIRSLGAKVQTDRGRIVSRGTEKLGFRVISVHNSSLGSYLQLPWR